MNPLSWITAGLRALGEIFGFINRKADLNNTPEMKKSQEAQKEAENDDEIARIIRDRDLKAGRNRLSD